MKTIENITWVLATIIGLLLFGMWLIGYDGNIKAYSEDGQLLTKLFEIIDKMPMRKGEMKSGSGYCIK